jgi:hypothetical protein
METNLFVGVGTDKDEYKPNDPIKIYAYVQDDNSPLGTAIVTAEINKSEGNVENIFLFDDGAHDDGEVNDGVYTRKARTTVWVELLPDLSISDSDISFSNTYPEQGGIITITAEIHNMGDGDAKDAKILFFDGDPAESDISIGEKIVDVTAGNISDVSVQWNATYGNHTIHVIISPFNGFLEKNYTNNHACANITVGDVEHPVANAGPDQIVLLNTNVFFDGSMSTDNVGIVNYTWDIDISYDSNGDGIPDNDVDLTDVNSVLIYSYHTTGTYTVKLSVNDAACNGPVSDTMIVEVTTDYDIEPPIAIAGPNQTVNLRTPVLFDGSNSTDNFGIASYFWDIDNTVDSDGDGIKDNDVDLVGPRPVLTEGYSTPGIHTVQLSVDDVAGNGPVNDTLIVTVVDTMPPTYSSVSLNNTVAGEITLFSVYWHDDALSGYIFATNNTGTWENVSWIAITGNGNWSNVTEILNSTVGVDIGWRIYANDTSNNWNSTGVHVFTTTLQQMPNLVINENWVNGPDNCTICYNVTNIGNGMAQAGHNTTLYVGGIEVAHDHVHKVLAPNESYIGCFDDYNWTYAPTGDNITVCADNNNTLDEQCIEFRLSCRSVGWRCEP